MKILSVRQPWAWLLANGLKDIENRDWTTSYRGLVLIHAGRRFEGEAVDLILDRLVGDERKQILSGASAFPRGGIIGIARLVDVVTESESKWFMGRYGWVFDRAMPLPLIPSSGNPLLLDAPADIVEQVKAACQKRGVA